MPETVSELNIILKSVAVRFYYIIIGVSLFFSIYYWYLNLEPMNYIMSSFFVFHITTVYIPYRLDYQSIKLLIPFYLFAVSISLFPIVVVFWQLGQITTFIWYLLVPLGAMVFLPTNRVIFWSIVIFIFIGVCFLVVPFIPNEYKMSLSEEDCIIINILTIISCFGLFYYFVHYINKTNHIRVKIHQEGRIINDLTHQEEKAEDIEKYNEVYNLILSYLENNKSYCDPDFTISQLASSVDSNISYISRAIKHCADMNFNVFINTYRIRMIKDMFDKGYQNTYTIKYIYTSSGFKQQTTFNKVFKQVEGITPTDYIKNLSETVA